MLLFLQQVLSTIFSLWPILLLLLVARYVATFLSERFQRVLRYTSVALLIVLVCVVFSSRFYLATHYPRQEKSQEFAVAEENMHSPLVIKLYRGDFSVDFVESDTPAISWKETVGYNSHNLTYQEYSRRKYAGSLSEKSFVLKRNKAETTIARSDYSRGILELPTMFKGIIDITGSDSKIRVSSISESFNNIVVNLSNTQIVIELFCGEEEKSLSLSGDSRTQAILVLYSECLYRVDEKLSPLVDAKQFTPVPQYSPVRVDISGISDQQLAVEVRTLHNEE